MSFDDEIYDYSNRHGSRNSQGGGQASDMGSALKEKVCVGDDGKIQVFGKSFDVGGREVAFFLGPLINLGITNAGLYGAKYVGKAGMSLGTAVKMETQHAAVLGKVAYFTWMFGLNATDALLSVKKAVKEGIQDIHNLQAQAQPLLAASDNKHVGIGKALTSKYTILAHAREKAISHFKHNLAGAVAGTVRALPLLLMGYNQMKLDEITNPKLVYDLRNKKGMKPAEKTKLGEAMADLRERQMPAGEMQKIREEHAKANETLKRPDPNIAADELERQANYLETHPPKFPEKPAYQSRYTVSPEEQHQREIESLYAQAESYRKEITLKLTPAEKKLIGSLEVTPELQAKQISLIERLREMGPVGDVKIPQVEAERTGIIKELEKIKLDAINKAKAVHAEIDKPRRTHLKELRSMGGVTQQKHDEQPQHPVLEMFSWVMDGEARKRMNPFNKTNHGVDYKKNIQKLQPLPAIATVVGDAVDRKISKKELPDTAWDKLMELQSYLSRHHTPDRDQVAVDVKKIFKQHVKDLGFSYHLEGEGYEQALSAITDAIVDEKLNPQAIANILDNKKIVVFSKDDADFGDLKDVKQQLESLTAQYSKVNDKDIFKEIKPEDLVRIYKDMPAEDKPFFTMLFPPGVLEKAGVPKDEVAQNRAEGTQDFVENLADKVRLLVGAGHDEIRKQGVKGKYIQPIEAIEEGFRRADRDGEASDFIRDNMKDVVKAVRNIETSAKKPGQMWKDFVARDESKKEEQTAKTPMDHAARESGDEMHIGG